MIKGIMAASIGLLSISFQNTKDLVTIICLIKILHQEVIQGRIELIDNMPLEEFVTSLSMVYGFQFIVRQLKFNLNSAASQEPGTDSHFCYLDIFRCRLNPYWLPFMRETRQQ